MVNLSIAFDNSYARLPDRFFSRQEPEPVLSPKLVKINDLLCSNLGLDAALLSTSRGVNIFAGNVTPDGADPIALAYAGHQFGGWVPQLGDGRAVLLGEVVGSDGKRRDIQLKGSGRTPFSRGGDGRAPLGPVLREYIVSDAMHALGVPTTRALAAVTTGENVIREAFLPGAVLTRVADSHVRVGTFQYFAARKDDDAVRVLADYVIDRHYPEVSSTEHPYRGLLSAIVQRQAELIAKWFSVGFIHGVMNTDNTSIAGETIDYGPCAFIDSYDPKKVFSSIDHMGRYAFINQPAIMHWNLAQLGQCLLPLLDVNIDNALNHAQNEINKYPAIFEAALGEVMACKLGCKSVMDGDLKLAMDLLECMAKGDADFTNTFRHIANLIDMDPMDDSNVRLEFSDPKILDEWLDRWKKRIELEPGSYKDIGKLMREANPAVIPRNHLVEAAIRAAEDLEDFGPFNALVDEVTHPFESRVSGSRYTRPPNSEEMVYQTFCGT